MLQQLILTNHLESAKAFHHHSNLTWKQHLVSSFTKGHRESFFSIFDLLTKEDKLQFYLKVYFLIYSIHPHLNQNSKNSAIPEKEITSFREFLDTKGADLAKTTQFLEFYALPFIKKPLEHATFKTLFTKMWVNNLKEKLLAYIQIEQESMKQASKTLFTVVSPAVSTPTLQPKPQPQSLPLINQPQHSSQKPMIEQKFKQLQKTNQQLFQQLELIKSRYQALQQNHQSMIEQFNHYMMDSQNKWFQSYKQLVKTAKGLLNIVGQQVGDNPKLQRKYLQGKKKLDKYQRFVARKLQDLLSISQDISVFDKPSMNQISQYTMKSGYTSKSWLTQMDKNLSNNNNNITSYVQIDQYVPTNFYRLNNDFIKMHSQDQQMILQGFCWRLIKAKNPQVRRMYCVAMIMGNFVGLGRKDVSDQGGELELCTKFLCSRSVSTKVLELVNYLKVDYYTRQYLFIENNITFSLMQTMAQALQQGQLQAISVALDIVSTISVYKTYRKPLLDAQLPIFLLNVLQSYPKLFQSQQLMELILMTLMNFSSCDQGLKMFQQYVNVFCLLSASFQHQSHDIMMLVNGFYFTLLASPVLYNIALQSNMLPFVQHLLTNENYKEHQRQLKFIEERLKKFCGQQTKKPNDQDQAFFLIDGEDQSQEIQFLEQQLENLEEYIRGHEFLSSKYTLREKQADQQQKLIKKINLQFIQKISHPLGPIDYHNKPKEEKTKVIQTQQNTPTPHSSQNIPQESRLKKPNQLKSEEIQLSMLSLNANQQGSIKQEVFNSPNPKFDPTLKAQKIPGNTKEAQFLGLLNNEQNPTFAKQKSSPNQVISSPSVPMAQNHNLPNFGSLSPQQQLDPAQKSRRKQILKQINEEIQSKKKVKAQRQAQRQKTKQSSDQNTVERNGNFSKKKEPLQEEIRREQRGNMHMRKEENEKIPKEKLEERKAFESRPRINRTPPRQQSQ